MGRQAEPPSAATTLAARLDFCSSCCSCCGSYGLFRPIAPCFLEEKEAQRAAGTATECEGPRSARAGLSGRQQCCSSAPEYLLVQLHATTGSTATPSRRPCAQAERSALSTGTRAQ